jgi:hypothetical protein
LQEHDRQQELYLKHLSEETKKGGSRSAKQQDMRLLQSQKILSSELAVMAAESVSDVGDFENEGSEWD